MIAQAEAGRRGASGRAIQAIETARVQVVHIQDCQATDRLDMPPVAAIAVRQVRKESCIGSLQGRSVGLLVELARKL